MLSKAKLYSAFVIVTIVLLCLFTYANMLSLGFEESTGSFSSIVRLAVVAMAVLTMVLDINEMKTGFTILWFFWAVWLLIDFFLLGLRGEGIANIFNVLFAPMTFLLFYHSGIQSPKTETIAFWGFVVLFAIAFYMNISNLEYRTIDIGEETGISNLVYWCLCVVPFLFLTEKRWLQLVFLGLSIVVVLLTSKRSASIAMLLIVLVYLLYSTKESKHRIRNLFLLVVVGVLVYYIINRYFIGSFMGLTERFSNISDDEGSGRIPLYRDVFAVLSQNSLVDWLVGRGYGSIIITKHTNAHNDALHLLFEYGFVGLLFYILLLLFVIKRTLRLRKDNSSFYMGYVASLIIVVVLGAVSNLVVFYSYFAFICAYWGIVEARMDNINRIKLLFK